MDPISQGLIGASAAQSKADKANARWATAWNIIVTSPIPWRLFRLAHYSVRSSFTLSSNHEAN